MFRENIRSPLVSGVGASNLFRNIVSEGTGIDESFLGTLRALLYKRIGGGSLRFSQATRLARSLTDESLSEPSNDTLTLYFYRRAHDDDTREALRKEFEQKEEMWPGWKRVEKVTAFFSKYTVFCYVNPEKKAAAVMILRRPDSKVYHFIQCAIPVYLPWYFPVSEGFSPLEMRLIKSLREETPDEYIACIDEFADLYELREAGIRALVGDIESRYEKAESERVKSQLRDLSYDIQRCNDTLRDYFKQKRDLDIRLTGLMTRAKSRPAESPLVGYFKNNKHAEVTESDEESITVVIRDCCSIYDARAAESMIENADSMLYGWDGDLDNADLHDLLRAIFVDRTLKLNFCAAYRLELVGGFRGLNDYNYGPKYSDCMPNPHINRYSCTGDYDTDVIELIQAGDLVGAVETAAASCVSLNFDDGTVIQTFMKYMQGQDSVNIRCIVLPDGSVVTPKDAVRYLKGE